MSQKQWHPDIEVTATLAKHCIETQFQQLSPIKKIQCIGEGWDNKAYLVNDAIIFRFPHRTIAVDLIERENQVLQALQSRFSIAIPNPQYLGKPSEHYPYPFHGYPVIKGLSGCHAKLSRRERQASIQPLALFLKALHTISETEAPELGAQDQWVDRTNTARMTEMLAERVENINRQNIVTIDNTVFEAEVSIANALKLTEYPKVLVHGDLYCRHLLFDQGQLSGIIDWGDSGINIPSIDLALLYSFYPAEAHPAFFAIYGEVDSELLKHARFLALYSMLTVLLYGDDIGDKQLVIEAKRAIKEINPKLLSHC
ncbi:MAG: phosphotransferase [Coxiellaceae bacterium]|nr:phosphotransferase [Coxiellaceae bacterium]